MPVIETLLEVDWNADDDFHDTGEELSGDLYAVECRRGNDHDSLVMPGSTAGTLRALLNNSDGQYSPFNTSSPLTGLLLPGRKVRLRAGISRQRKAARFAAASSEHLTIADNAALSIEADMTISAWVKAGADGVNGGVLNKWTTTGDQRAYRIVRSGSDVVAFHVSPDGTSPATATVNASGTLLAADGFVHYVAEHEDGVEIRISKNNGTPAVTAHTTGIVNSTAPFQVGSQLTDATYFTGDVDQLGIWDRLLTTAELTWLYNSGTPRSYSELGIAGTDGADLLTGLVAFWELEETSGTRYDAHGANHLSDINTVTSADSFSQLVYATLWTGYLDRIEPSVELKSLPKATLYASGCLVKLAGQNNKISPPAYAGGRTGALIDDLLDAASWPAGDRDIDAGNVEVGRVYFEDVEALESLRQIWEDTEGGFLYEDLDFGLRFEERYARQINNTVSQATFTDDGVGPLGYQRVDESDPLAEIFNEVTVQVQPYQAGPFGVLWTLANEVVTLAAGESRTYIAKATTINQQQVVYVESWTTPVVGTDIMQSGVADGDIGVSVSKTATTMFITVTNNHGSAVATLTMQARGLPILARNPFKLAESDATSQTKYGRRTLPHPGRWFPNAAFAQGSIDYTIAKVKDPHPIMAIEVVGSDAAHRAQMIDRAISERITLEAENATQLGVSQDFYIEAISHSIQRGKLPRTVFELTPVVDLFDGDSLFTLDVSLLDGADVLAY